MLGPDWLVEVTDLVSDFMRVGDPRVAHLVDSNTLAGLEPGATPFKVRKGSIQVQNGRPGSLGYLRVEGLHSETTAVAPKKHYFPFFLSLHLPNGETNGAIELQEEIQCLAQEFTYCLLF